MLREFVDRYGRMWEVWDTHPERADASDGGSALTRYMAAQPETADGRPMSVRRQYESGWLTFASGTDRRRLSPIPDDWQHADAATLARYLEGAHDIGLTPNGKTERRRAPGGPADRP